MKELDDLKEVVAAIKENRPLPSSVEIDNLLEQVIANNRPIEDIEKWAQHLADDVGSLTD